MREVPVVIAAICEWIYVRNVRVRHRPSFIIASELCPDNQSAIAPEARNECAPIRDN